MKTTSSPLKYSFDMVKNNMQLLTYVEPTEKLLDRRVDAIEIDEAIFYSTMMFYDCYYAMNADRWWTQDGKPFVAKTEKRIKEYYKEFKYLIDQCPQQAKDQIAAGIKTRYTQEGLVFEKETFDTWFKRLLANIK